MSDQSSPQPSARGKLHFNLKDRDATVAQTKADAAKAKAQAEQEMPKQEIPKHGYASRGVATLRHHLLDFGYPPLPQTPTKKAVLIPGWSSLDAETIRYLIDAVPIPEEEEQGSRWNPSTWAWRFQSACTAVRCDNLVAFDIDLDGDQELCREVEQVIVEEAGPWMLKRLSREGRALLPYRPQSNGKDFRWCSTGRWHDGNESAEEENVHVHMLEVLTGKGQTFGALGLHSRVGVNDIFYQWEVCEEVPEDLQPLASDCALGLLEAEHLPAVTAEQVSRIIDRVRGLFAKRGLTELKSKHPTRAGTPGEHSRAVCESLTLDLMIGDRTVREWMEGEEDYDQQRFPVPPEITEGGDNPTSFKLFRGRDGLLAAIDFGDGHLLHVLTREAKLELSGGAADPQELPPEELSEIEPEWEGELPEWHLRHRAIQEMPNGTPEEKVKRIAATYAFAAERNRYYRIDSGILSPPVVPSAMARRYPSQIMIANPSGRGRKPVAVGEHATKFCTTIDGLRFDPREPHLFNADGHSYLNVYRPPLHLPSARRDGLVMLLTLLDRITDRPEDKQWVLTWLAYKIQHPWIRGPGVVSISKEVDASTIGKQQQGTGRGTFTKLLRKLMGRDYIRDVPFAKLANQTYQAQYNDWMSEALFAVVQEALDSEPKDLTKRNRRRATYESIKRIVEVGESFEDISRKGLNNTMEEVFCTLFIGTNNPDLLEIPEDDRRLYVVRSLPLPPTERREFWNQMHADIDNKELVSALYGELRHFDTGSYSPFDPVPMTPAKEALIKHGGSDITEMLVDLIEWLPGDIVTLRMIEPLIRNYGREFGLAEAEEEIRILRKQVRDLGKPLDPTNPRRQFKTTTEDTPQRPLILRNVKEWQELVRQSKGMPKEANQELHKVQGALNKAAVALKQKMGWYAKD